MRARPGAKQIFMLHCFRLECKIKECADLGVPGVVHGEIGAVEHVVIMLP